MRARQEFFRRRYASLLSDSYVVSDATSVIGIYGNESNHSRTIYIESGSVERRAIRKYTIVFPVEPGEPRSSWIASDPVVSAALISEIEAAWRSPCRYYKIVQVSHAAMLLFRNYMDAAVESAPVVYGQQDKVIAEGLVIIDEWTNSMFTPHGYAFICSIL